MRGDTLRRHDMLPLRCFDAVIYADTLVYASALLLLLQVTLFRY